MKWEDAAERTQIFCLFTAHSFHIPQSLRTLRHLPDSTAVATELAASAVARLCRVKERERGGDIGRESGLDRELSLWIERALFVIESWRPPADWWNSAEKSLQVLLRWQIWTEIHLRSHQPLGFYSQSVIVHSNAAERDICHLTVILYFYFLPCNLCYRYFPFREPYPLTVAVQHLIKNHPQTLQKLVYIQHCVVFTEVASFPLLTSACFPLLTTEKGLFPFVPQLTRSCHGYLLTNNAESIDDGKWFWWTSGQIKWKQE